MTKHLFISKNYAEVQELDHFLNGKGIALIAQSFIHFEPVPFEIKNPFDILFFSSPRSFLFFHQLYKIPDHILIACPGNKTAALIQEMGYTVSFFGPKSGNIHETAENFKSWSENKRVLFPCSDRSLNTVSSALPASQVEQVIVYKTITVSKPLAYCDMYVFTSPSNVEGFFKLNTIPDSAEIYSWGQSTTQALQNQGVHVKTTLENSSVEDLISVLSK